MWEGDPARVCAALTAQNWLGDAAWLAALAPEAFGGAFLHPTTGAPVLLALLHHGHGAPRCIPPGDLAWRDDELHLARDAAPSSLRATDAAAIAGVVRVVRFHGQPTSSAARARVAELLVGATRRAVAEFAQSAGDGARDMALGVLGIVCGSTTGPPDGRGTLAALGARAAVGDDTLTEIVLAPDACTRGALPYAWNEIPAEGGHPDLRGFVVQWMARAAPWGAVRYVSADGTLLPARPAARGAGQWPAPRARRLDTLLCMAGAIRRGLPGSTTGTLALQQPHPTTQCPVLFNGAPCRSWTDALCATLPAHLDPTAVFALLLPHLAADAAFLYVTRAR